MSRIRPGDGDVRHGTVNGYVNLRCRCQQCRDAWAERCMRRKYERASIIADDPTAAEHGRATTYQNWSCRCEPCTTAYTAYQQARGAR